MDGHASTRRTHQHTREKRCKQKVLLACGNSRTNNPQNLTSGQDLLTMVETSVRQEHAYRGLTRGCSHKRKPHCEGKNDIMAHSRGDAAIAVWQVHVSQCEFERIMEFLSVMPMSQLQSCVVAPSRKPLLDDVARNWLHTCILNVTLQYPSCLARS